MCVCIYVLGTCYLVCCVGCRCDVWSSKRTFGFKLDGQVEDGPNNSGGAGVHARSGSVRRSVAFARPPVTKMPPTGATSVRKTAFSSGASSEVSRRRRRRRRKEGRGDRTQGGNSTFSQQQSRRMQERVVESKIDGDSLESLSTKKINGQASVGAQYVHTYGIQYAAFHGIMAYLSVVLVLRLFYIMYVRTTYGSFAAITHVS